MLFELNNLGCGCDTYHLNPQFASSLLKHYNSSQLNRLGREQLWKWKRETMLIYAPQFTKIFNKHHLRNRFTVKLKMLWLPGSLQVQALPRPWQYVHTLCVFVKFTKVGILAVQFVMTTLSLFTLTLLSSVSFSHISLKYFWQLAKINLRWEYGFHNIRWFLILNSMLYVILFFMIW